MLTKRSGTPTAAPMSPLSRSGRFEVYRGNLEGGGSYVH
jgi:hypothetical protein